MDLQDKRLCTFLVLSNIMLHATSCNFKREKNEKLVREQHFIAAITEVITGTNFISLSLEVNKKDLTLLRNSNVQSILSLRSSCVRKVQIGALFLTGTKC